jgi:zinc finger FYVE domain-containing protein 1
VAHQLRERFAKLDLGYSAFSSLEYVGTRTCFSSSLDKNFVSTDFTQLAQTVRYLLRNNSVRPPRKLSSIYQVFKVLNDKFNGVITKNQVSTFADEYFTCSAICLSCG